MALKDIVKVNRKTYINPRAWLGYDYLKAQTIQIYATLRQLFTVPIPAREETFDQAVKRLHLSEKHVHELQRNYLITSIIFVILAAVAFAFSFVLMLYFGTFSGWLLAIAATALLLTQAFRYHFWHFQIKFRKLGCTFAEWKQGKPFDLKGGAE